MKKKEEIILFCIYILLFLLIGGLYKTNQEEEIIANVNEITTKKQETTTITTTKKIVWDNLTLEELTIRLDNNLYDDLKGTGKYFAKFAEETGLDPYLAISIVNLETGCKWGCSKLTVNCNNIGGLKGKPSCNGSSYMKFNTLEEGINGYLNIIYKNYWLKGLDTAEKMNSKYAEDKKWAEKVNAYYDTITNKK